jgi:hypothetical protein
MTVGQWMFHHKSDVAAPAPEPAAVAAEPQKESIPMSTTPTPVPAPVVKATPVQKFESFFTKFGKVLRDIENAVVNIAEQQEVNIDQIIPPAQAQNLHILISAAAAQVAAADAKYDALGKTDVPYAVKVAEAVAVSGGTFLVVAAKLGFAIPQAQLGTFFGAAGQIAGSLNFTDITKTPTVPAA